MYKYFFKKISKNNFVFIIVIYYFMCIEFYYLIIKFEWMMYFVVLIKVFNRFGF